MSIFDDDGVGGDGEKDVDAKTYMVMFKRNDVEMTTLISA
jgi:hypothetical protein